MRLEDLPERYRLQALSQIAGHALHNRAVKTPAHPRKANDDKSTVPTAPRATRGKSRGIMNATEAKYNRDFLNGAGKYESITLRLPGGSRYTPDFMTVGTDGQIILHEVKGVYRFHSEGRARTAWRECAAAFPMFRFVWAKWTGKRWELTDAQRSEG